MTLPDESVRSWYAATSLARTDHPPLDGDLRADVCIVGAGYTGLSAALHLAERGYDVVVLEAERVGWGASGRNGGQIVTGYNKPMGMIARRVGREDAARLWEMGEEAKRLIAELTERHRIDCGLKWGYLFAGMKPRHLAELGEMLAEWRDDYGYDGARLVDRDEMRSLVAARGYIGGLYDAGGGQLHPLNYALGLGRAASA
jgi:gamma-glutamylputrescine oxidase